ncbi:DUF1961 family protein [Tamlana fucoidanivorans]|uniref:DUF1961 family protein n=1 Tax=Allotamlana fucoidanivorans TaxID=2583814 RepID=A0A5C4SPH2_9FLAO|nr:DUF1961 family protein [Tamlana fucoidanivorans]TNJ46030.1 DUF1961 family protein [Tamlana fucoidanivorans]
MSFPIKTYFHKKQLIFLFLNCTFSIFMHGQITNIDANELANWDLHGIGSVSYDKNEKAVKLTESKESLGAMLVSPTSYSENLVVTFKVKPLQHEGVCVILLGLNDLDGGDVTIPKNYNGDFNFWKSEKSTARSHAFAFHTAFHQPNAFIKENPGFINIGLQKDVVTEEKWYNIEVGKINSRFWMKVNGKTVIDTLSNKKQRIFNKSKIALRVRGPGDGTFSALYKDLVIKENLNYKNIYACNFNESKDLEDWILEGPGKVKLKKDRLLIHSKYQKFIHKKWKKGRITINSTNSNYYPVLRKKMISDLKINPSDYSYEGSFSGGPVVLWNKTKTPENYEITFNFKSLSPHSLHMIIFSALGLNGESIFSSDLAKRNGTAPKYTKGDISNYRISYFAPIRKTANLRKSPGRKMLDSGIDFASQSPKELHRIRVQKWKNNIVFTINDKQVLNYSDDEKALGAGYFGLRLMVPAIGTYDNFNLYELKNGPF